MRNAGVGARREECATGLRQRPAGLTVSRDPWNQLLKRAAAKIRRRNEDPQVRRTELTRGSTHNHHHQHHHRREEAMEKGDLAEVELAGLIN